MRSKKQTERQKLLMESSLAYPRGKEEKSNNSKRRQNSKGEQTLGYLGVVKPVTPKEDVPLRVVNPDASCESEPLQHGMGSCSWMGAVDRVICTEYKEVAVGNAW
ncbi:hypothetical protein AVEN_176757-1 [Araneus ventricosus]|uniref:Uncharacterized protein n=1 Tax=Araneus ventricosus TaxID=182803 RepID=A0A4Y2QA90_ARAVE|nr:hypothetical protein AVEN_70658-1 [Araneus ventricosus]GBN60479.1 hypothetical protein AVEN_176757-1 [Araneus ventricosus]